MYTECLYYSCLVADFIFSQFGSSVLFMFFFAVYCRTVSLGVFMYGICRRCRVSFHGVTNMLSQSVCLLRRS